MVEGLRVWGLGFRAWGSYTVLYCGPLNEDPFIYSVYAVYAL